MLATVNLVFDAEDERGFGAARPRLLDGFEGWLRKERSAGPGAAAQMASDAGIAVDWKWSYGDGDLGRWDTGDAADFLLRWCPRKLSVSQAECATIPPALAAFAHFLDAEGLLAAGSAPAAVLQDAIAAMTDEFVAAMGDSSKFGMAKSMFSGAAADGIDITDPEQVQQWISRFNELSEDERRRLVPDTALGLPEPAGRPVLPPVVLPADHEIAASKAAAPILRMFGDLAAYVGDGRKLTQTGNLTLADARVLVDLLGTGDVLDYQDGDRTVRTRSAANLPRLRLVFGWAKKAGILRVHHGKVIATRRGLGVSGTPDELFDRAADALVAIGPLTAQRDPSWPLAWPEVNEFLDRSLVYLLAMPYVADGAVPVQDIAGAAVDSVRQAFEFGQMGVDLVALRIPVDVEVILDSLELAGIVRRVGADVTDSAEVTGSAEVTDSAMVQQLGGSVELTPAGVVTVRRLLVSEGYDAPAAGRLADATAAELLAGTDRSDFPVLWAEVEAWRSRRDPAQAVAEMADAVRELDDPAVRSLALAVMGDIGPAIAGPFVRALAAEPATRGFALCWLVEFELEPEQALFDPGDLYPFADVLVHRLVMAGPEGLISTLALAGDQDRQIKTIGQLWQAPSAATETVLAAIGETHPAKAVAKAARKALFRRRGWLAGR